MLSMSSHMSDLIQQLTSRVLMIQLYHVTYVHNSVFLRCFVCLHKVL